MDVSLLVLVGLLLVLMGVLAAKAMRRRAGIVAGVGASLCALALLAGARGAALPVPIGLAGGGGALQLDGLSALFLFLSFLVAAFAEAEPLCLVATCLAMLAGDLVLLAAAAALALLALPPQGLGRRPGRLRTMAAGGLVGACALLGGVAAPAGALLPETGFSLVRDGVATLGREAAVLLPVLVLLGVAPLLGLWPLAAWHRRLCGTAPPWAAALASLLGLFLLLRLLLGLAGSAPAAGWGYGLAALGIASALAAAVGALRAQTLRGAVARLLAVQNGLAVLGVGICLLARTDDLPGLAAAALDAVLLLLPTQVLAGLAMLTLAAGMEEEAGASLLARLGGLVQSMPRATALAAVAVAMLAFLPPVGGFPALWLLLQSTLAVARVAPVPALLAMVAAAVAVALSGLAWVRLVAVAGLGRPRTPRGAAAQEIGGRLGRTVAAMLVLPGLIGLLPGVWLRLLRSVGAGLAAGVDADPPPLLHLVVPGGGATLSPLALAVLLLVAIGGCLLLGRRLAVRPERRAPAWEDGIAPPPPWLPFGDPLTQIGPATLVRMVGRQAGPAGWPGLSRMRPRRLRAMLAAPEAVGAWLLAALRRHGAVLALALLAGLLASRGA